MNVPLAVLLAESVTVALNENVPAAGGVPSREPPVLRPNQLGRLVAVQVYGPVPPVAANCSE
jgi:hypothetical protein